MAGVINTTYSFTATDLVTSTKLNNLIDETVFTADAYDGTTITIGSGKLKVATGGITSNEIAANAVVTAGILDLNVTAGKLADAAVTTSKITDLNVTAGKLAADSVTTAKILNANVTAAKLDGAQTGSAPIFGVRAWATFDMTKNAAGVTSDVTGTRYILGSGNVTSVTRNDDGEFTILFATALPNAYYAYAGSGMDTDTVGDVTVARENGSTKTTTQLRLKAINGNGDGQNFPEITVMVIG